MPNLFRRGERFVTTQLQRSGGVTIVYARGEDTVEIIATIGKTDRTIETTDNALMRWESRDFLFPASSLRLAEGIVEPKEGDLITEKDCCEDGRVYEVSAPAGQTHFRYADQSRSRFRVHTTLRKQAQP